MSDTDFGDGYPLDRCVFCGVDEVNGVCPHAAVHPILARFQDLRRAAGEVIEELDQPARCRNCVAFESYDGFVGTCHVGPPHTGDDDQAVWPRVQGTDYCGMHERGMPPAHRDLRRELAR